MWVKMSYSDVGPTGLVDSVHVFAEFRSVAISIPVVLGDEEKSVDHLMKKGLWTETADSYNKCKSFHFMLKSESIV